MFGVTPIWRRNSLVEVRARETGVARHLVEFDFEPSFSDIRLMDLRTRKSMNEEAGPAVALPATADPPGLREAGIGQLEQYAVEVVCSVVVLQQRHDFAHAFR